MNRSKWSLWTVYQLPLYSEYLVKERDSTPSTPQSVAMHLNFYNH